MSPDVQEIIEQVRQHPRLVIADDFEISVQRVATNKRKFHNGEESLLSKSGGYWISLRLLHRRQPGRAVTHFRNKDALGNLVDSAFESASRSNVDLWFRFPLWKRPQGQMSGKPRAAPLEPYEPLFPKLAVVPDVLDETYEAWELETHLYRKSERIQMAHTRQMHSAKFAVLNHGGDKYYWVREERALARPLTEREEWLEGLLRQSHALRAGRFHEGGGVVNVVMSPLASAALLNRLAPSFHADAVQNGKSPLTGTARPSPLFSPAITIVDSGNYPDAPNSAPFDLEGSLTQDTTLVAKGELRDLLYDTYSATRENRLSTGNFSRVPGVDSPRIAATTLYVQKSNRPAHDLLRQAAGGVLLETIDSIETHPASESELLVRGSGWVLDGNGRGEPVWDIPLKIGLFDIFRRAVAVGDDLTFYGSCGAPSILFENVPLSE